MTISGLINWQMAMQTCVLHLEELQTNRCNADVFKGTLWVAIWIGTLFGLAGEPYPISSNTNGRCLNRDLP